MSTTPVPMTDTTFDLLDRARATLLQACRAQTTNDRYIAAHLGALRAAAALLSARARRRGAPVSHAWATVQQVAPELAEWAEYFSVAGERRLQLEAGGPPATHREADDLLRAAETFHGLVMAALGLPLEALPPRESALAVAGRG